MTAGALESRYRERSLWLDGLAGTLAPRPALPGDLDCDVVVVGAGMTGLWAAYNLRRADPTLRVTVLEREIAGFGPSGRNGGWVSSGLAGSASVYERRGGRDAVRRALRETYRAVALIGEVAEREEIDCGYRRAGGVMVATSAPQLARLKAGIAELRELGAGDEDARVLGAAETDQIVRVRGRLASTYYPHCARIDPARLVRGLADACERAGVTIHERTEAVRIERGRVLTAGGATVRAPVVLRATESYTTRFPGEHRTFLPLYSLMIATEPLPGAVWEELGWGDGLLVGDRHHLFFYAQRTVDGRIAIGGRGAPYDLREPLSERYERSPQVRERLERALRRHFPAAAGAAVTHHWGGPLGVPRDWCMSVRFDRASGLGSAGGYSGHGVVSANIAGRTLADLVLGVESELTSLPWVGHRSRRWEPEPFRYIASRAIVGLLGAADRREDASGRPDRRTLLVSPFMPPD
ncbi:MAG TPA: FAD-binding oxidoreductase [Gaiellales bacterium]|nr:FAD-binding oxidoreductase [Gaiellales bacterium]